MDTSSMMPAGKTIINMGDTGSGSHTDPALLALMSGQHSMLSAQNSGGLLGGGGGLLPLLIGAFLFGGNRLGLGGIGAGVAAGGAALAAESIMTSKDISSQLNTFQSWAQSNASTLASQLCTSSSNIINAVNNVNQQMFQAFVGQAQAQTAQMNNMQSTITAQNTVGFTNVNDRLASINQNLSDKISLIGSQIDDDINQVQSTIAAGFSAGQLSECQTQNLINMVGATNTAAIQQAITSGNYALATQIANCCCENRLAIANQNALIERNTAALSNQINIQTCDIKSAIATDGQATRALLNDQRITDLESQLADQKSAVRDAAILAAIAKNGDHH
jgi:predicted transcriptional regulator